ncbi:melanocortin receptor 4-like [Lytechinus variegatus]|uniref:melanocortin receptor 4-like n=1 Tax=Lytechinus variegatus TaxID=7654 RepID=UPI001BB19CBF|nr:melanocortin receptor 4-like [Lytechinus variegatus]
MADLNEDMAEIIFQGLAFTLNALTVGIIITIKKMRKRQNIFTCNIALADGLSALLVIVAKGLLYQGVLYRGVLWILLSYRSLYFIGIFSTLAVALHRFIIIRFDPFNKRNIVTAPRCIIGCFLIWAVPFVTFFSIDLSTSLAIIRLGLPAMIFATNGISTVCYLLVYWAITRAAHAAGLSDRALVQRLQQNRRVLVTFALVVLTNIVCWTPYCICNFISTARPDLAFDNRQFTPWYGVTFKIARGMQSLNGVLNPIIYWSRLTDFRQLLKEVCPCRKTGGKETASSIANNSSVAETSLRTEPSESSPNEQHEVRGLDAVQGNQVSYVVNT